MKRLLLATLVFLGLLGIALAAEIEDLDTTDASNTGRFPELMAASDVNNGARALEGMLARFYNDLGCRISTGGSSSAYTFAASQAVTSYFDGLILCFDTSVTSAAGATLNVDSLGAKTIRYKGADLVAGEISTDQKVLVTYDGTNFQVLSVTRAITSADDVITTRGDLIVGNSSAEAARVAVGNADEILGSDGTDAAWRAITSYVSAQGDLEGATAITGYTSPGRQQFHPSAAKLWANFSVAGALADSFNVASITATGAGDYTVVIATDFSSVNYAALVSAQPQGPAAGTNAASGTANLAVTSYIIRIEESDGTLTDPVSGNIYTVAFGDQ